MKKIIASVLALAAALTMSVNTFAVSVVVNDNTIDTEAVIVDGRTLVPVRGVFESLGYNVEWDANTKTASLTKDSDVITITSGMETFSVNDDVITPDVPQQIINDRFMLPLRAISESIGANVEWNEETKTVIITTFTGLRVVETLELGDGTIIDPSQINEISLD